MGCAAKAAAALAETQELALVVHFECSTEAASAKADPAAKSEPPSAVCGQLHLTGLQPQLPEPLALQTPAKQPKAAQPTAVQAVLSEKGGAGAALADAARRDLQLWAECECEMAHDFSAAPPQMPHRHHAVPSACKYVRVGHSEAVSTAASLVLQHKRTLHGGRAHFGDHWRADQPATPRFGDHWRADQLATLQVRRGDMVNRCNTTVAAVVEYVSCSLSASKALKLQGLWLFTDERSRSLVKQPSGRRHSSAPAPQRDTTGGSGLRCLPGRSACALQGTSAGHGSAAISCSRR